MKAKTPSTKLKIGVGYIRESTEEQDKGFSPENQKRTIEEYANKNGIKITDWYKDLVSGTQALKRDDFQRMIGDAMLRKFEVILVFHTSRFARNVQEARQYKDLLRKKQGIEVVFVTQHFGDFNSPSGFLNEGVNELFDEYYSKQLSFWVRSNLMEKRRQGKQNGNPPLGYYKKKIGFDKEKNRTLYDKTWRVHPQEAKIVKKIFTMYATGKYSLLAVAKEMSKQGYKTKQGHLFTYSSTKCIVNNKVYLGLVYSKRRGYPTIKGIHPAIIPQKLFDKVQDVLYTRKNTSGRPVAQHRFYLLQGLVYCHRCIKYLKGKEDKPRAKFLPNMYCETHFWKNKKNYGGERLYYACKMARETKTCNQPDIEVSVIDKQVLAVMESFKLPNDVIDSTLKKLKELFEHAGKGDNDGAVQRLETKKKRLNYQYLNTEELTEEEYQQQLREINEEIKKFDALGLASGNRKGKEVEYLKKTEKFLTDFKAFWKSDIGNQERRAWIQMTMKRIWVKNQSVVAIEPQEDFKPLFVSHKKLGAQADSNP